MEIEIKIEIKGVRLKISVLPFVRSIGAAKFSDKVLDFFPRELRRRAKIAVKIKPKIKWQALFGKGKSALSGIAGILPIDVFSITR